MIELPEPLLETNGDVFGHENVQGFTADQMRSYGLSCARAAMEHAAQIIERMRDEHCRMTQMADDKRDHCFPGGGDGCEFVEAWNDAANAIRAEIEKEKAK